MDDLDHLYRRLLTVISTTRPEYAQIPFTVHELVEQLVPYRHNRRELGIDTNQDYEIAVARLLAGERDYVRAEPSVQEAVRKALASPTDDPGVFKEYAQAHMQLVSPTAAMTDVPPIPVPPADHTAVARPAATASTATSTATPTSPAAAMPSLLSSLSHIDVPTGCRFCGGTLPADRDVNYCPHCGENLKTRRCPACGSEMEATWRFCVTCGRRAL